MLPPKDTDWLNGYKNNTHIYAVYKRPTSDLWTYRQSEGMEKDIPCKWKSKESWSSNSHIKIDFKIKTITGDKEGHYSFLLISMCMKYLFPSSHFQSVCVPRSEVGLL